MRARFSRCARASPATVRWRRTRCKKLGSAPIDIWPSSISAPLSHAALQILRKRGRGEISESELGSDEQPAPEHPDHGPGPEREAQSGQIGRSIETQLQRMSVLERTAFVLRHHEGQSLEEIAAALSLSISACKQAIFRAVRKLRGTLEHAT